MAFASDAVDRTAHLPTHGDREGTFGFSFTLAKTLTAAFRGQYTASARPAGAASHTDPGRGVGPHGGAPPAPAAR